jgi:hypothetical protein
MYDAEILTAAERLDEVIRAHPRGAAWVLEQVDEPSRPLPPIGEGRGWHCWSCQWTHVDEAAAWRHAVARGHVVTRSEDTHNGAQPTPPA